MQSPAPPTRTRDLLGYAGSPPDPQWPGGVRVAKSIVVNFEEGAEFSVTHGDSENEAVYEIEQRLVGQPNPAIDSHFEYGSRAGWWRIIEVLGQHNAPVTVSSSGERSSGSRSWRKTRCAAATKSRRMAGGGKATRRCVDFTQRLSGLPRPLSFGRPFHEISERGRGRL